MNIIPDEKMVMFEYMKLTDPTMVESLKLLQNAKGDSKLAILHGRASKIGAKFSQLSAQLQAKGVEFIIATGKQSSKNQGSSLLTTGKKANKTSMGFYSSMDKGHV